MGQTSAAQQGVQTAASTSRSSGIEGDYGANRVGIEGAKTAAQQKTLSNLSTAWSSYNTSKKPNYNSGNVTEKESIFNY